jgi:hypothetical protein
MLESDRKRLEELLTTLAVPKQGQTSTSRTQQDVSLTCTLLHAIFHIGISNKEGFDLNGAEEAELVNLLACAVPRIALCVASCYLDVQVPRARSEALILRSAIEFITSACKSRQEQQKESASSASKGLEQLKAAFDRFEKDGTLQALEEIVSTAPSVHHEYETVEELTRLAKLAQAGHLPHSHSWWSALVTEAKEPEFGKVKDATPSDSEDEREDQLKKPHK